MIQPGTARLSSPYQYLKKESRRKGQEHHYFPPTLYWGWHRGASPPAPQKKAIPSKPSPLCLPLSLIQAVGQLPSSVPTPQQDSVPEGGDLRQGMLH